MEKGIFFWGGGEERRGRVQEEGKKLDETLCLAPVAAGSAAETQPEREDHLRRRATTPPPPFFCGAEAGLFLRVINDVCVLSSHPPVSFPFVFFLCSPRAPEMIVAMWRRLLVACLLVLLLALDFCGNTTTCTFCVYYNLLQVIIFSTCILSH